MRGRKFDNVKQTAYSSVRGACVKRREEKRWGGRLVGRSVGLSRGVRLAGGGRETVDGWMNDRSGCFCDGDEGKNELFTIYGITWGGKVKNAFLRYIWLTVSLIDRLDMANYLHTLRG